MTTNGKFVLEKCQVCGTMKNAVEELVDILKSLKSHIFRAIWNQNIFDSIR